MKARLLKVVFLGLAVSTGTFAGQGEPNCKLSLHVLYENGRKKLDISEIYALDREDCKYAAYLLRKDEMDRERVTKVKVFFAYDGRRRAN